MSRRLIVFKRATPPIENQTPAQRMYSFAERRGIQRVRFQNSGVEFNACAFQRLRCHQPARIQPSPGSVGSASASGQGRGGVTKLLQAHCRGPYSSEVDEFSLVSVVIFSITISLSFNPARSSAHSNTKCIKPARCEFFQAKCKARRTRDPAANTPDKQERRKMTGARGDQLIARTHHLSSTPRAAGQLSPVVRNVRECVERQSL